MHNNLLTINITNSCNLKCSYCPIPEKYKVPLDTDRTDVNIINNNDLLAWLVKWADPEKWFIEITGGEPGLYKEINTLLPALEALGYKGLVKTNGIVKIIRNKSFPLIVAWHINRPNYFDIICIIKNPDDNWQLKVDYCQTSNIPYRTVDFDRSPHGDSRDKNADKSVSIFNRVVHLNSSGQFTMCSRMSPGENNTIWNAVPKEGETMRVPCNYCKNVVDVEMFL